MQEVSPLDVFNFAPKTSQARVTTAFTLPPIPEMPTPIPESVVDITMPKMAVSIETPPPASPAGRQPTAEDILFLLLGQARDQREELEHLRAQNSTLTQDLHDCKEKYHKLKKWALEANDDFEKVSNETLRLKKSLDEVVKDKEAILSDLRNLHHGSADAIGQMARLQSSIRDINGRIPEEMYAFGQFQGHYAAQSDHLACEKLKCKDLETHIVHLRHDSNIQARRSGEKLEALNHELQIVSDQLLDLKRAGQNAQKSTEDHLKHCSDNLQNVVDIDHATKADMQLVIGSLGLVQATVRTGSSDCTKAMADAHLRLHDQLKALDQSEEHQRQIISLQNQIGEFSIRCLAANSAREGLLKEMQEQQQDITVLQASLVVCEQERDSLQIASFQDQEALKDLTLQLEGQSQVHQETVQQLLKDKLELQDKLVKSEEKERAISKENHTLQSSLSSLEESAKATIPETQLDQDGDDVQTDCNSWSTPC
ncbi:hypothetical protein RBB50_005629 [Rhinocladiella similis]